VLYLLAAAAMAHTLGHGEVRHELHLTVHRHEAVLEAEISLPGGLIGHDPALASDAWLRAGLQLRAGGQEAPVEVYGQGTTRRAIARVDLPAEAVELTVADHTLLTEHNLLRWTVQSEGRAYDADDLRVFDGHLRRSVDGRWVRERPRELVIDVAPASARWPWFLAVSLGLAALLASWAIRRAGGPGRPPAAASG